MSLSSAPKLVSLDAETNPALSQLRAPELSRPGPLGLWNSPELSRGRGFVVLGLALVAVALFVLSLWQPWWNFKLYAPQYPRGLSLAISLTGLSGDVREVDMLNHYIGMAHLDAAAPLERKYGAHAVLGICVLVVAMTVFGGRRLARWAALAGALFPIGFVVDTSYWLYRFGHDLDRRAPLHIPEFTPQMFGNGSIGQFMTFARPELGFWLASLGVVALMGVVIAREYTGMAPKQRQSHDAVNHAASGVDSNLTSKPE
jgi:copper chaperone NosL